MAERRQQQEPRLRFLANAGEMGALMQACDWSRTPIGPVDRWPQSLQTAVSILLTSRFAMWLGWGSELTFLYNDAYAPTLGVKHPWALGRPSREVWAEIWEDIEPRIDQVLRTGEATWDEALLLFLERHGFPEETYHTFSYSPLRGDDRKVMGHLCVVSEETERVIGERRLRLLRELAAAIAETRTPPELFAAAAQCLAAHRHDLPFSLTYLFEGEGKTVRLACASGFADGHPAAPVGFAVDAANALWPAGRVLATAAPVMVRDLAADLDLPKGPWSKPPGQAIALPIARQGQIEPAGVFVAGINPNRPFDGEYHGFLTLVTGQIAAGLAAAQAYEAERRRAEALAEIDRAKTIFFSNASHEFRTPLTLLLSPIEDLLLRSGNAPTVAADRAEIELMHRNGLRLLKLVNTLLDFSRIEAGRIEAVYEPVDLGAFTTELASAFRSAMERAGLRYAVDCPPLPEAIFVARDMWEKIVLNLLSNALKYTFEGEVAVRLRSTGATAVELTVRDTGIGIPTEELPRLFERFHRVEAQRGRTQEGTGIGLALVNELVRLHGGRVTVESKPGRGSMFTVAIPTGSAHLPADRIGGARLLAATEIRADAFVEEALRWLDAEIGVGPTSESSPIDSSPAADVTQAASRPVVLLADDNADMRDYVRRLLAHRFQVVAVANGVAALEEARRRRPDLILSDVMMPQLDGFGLLRAVRNDPELREIPFIILSARAGEEASVEGMSAGADDYLTKPFAARELVARVQANLEMARLRRETAETLRARTAELETLLETVPAGVWLTNDPDAGRVWGNRYAASLLRVPEDGNPSLTAPEGERPRHFHVFRGGVEADPLTLPLQRAARGEEVRDDEIEVRFADGRSLALLTHAAPVRDDAGRVVGAICAGIDITTRKDAEASLRRFNETLEERVVSEIDRRREAETALRQAQKMEAIGQLTGGVAHDMNNLLLVIQGNLEIVERQLPLGSERGNRMQRSVQAALGGVERAASLTQRLLAFARRQPLDPKPVEPDRLVGGMSDLLRRTLGETIAIETRLAGGVWHAFVDPNQLENAILNLAVNARDAMPEGGALTLETANARLDADDLGLRAEVISGDYVMIAVIDNGTGMTREAVDKAFEPFFTTKEIGKGTGLGLSQVYGFVKQSGGHVEIDSEIGRGTTLRIYLPRYTLEPDQPATDAAAPATSGPE